MIKAFDLIQHTAYAINDNTIAIQKQGIAMGTCDSPVEANLTLLFYEYNFHNILSSFIIYKRYIDDILVVIPKSDTKQLTKTLQSILPTNLQLEPTKQPT